MGCAAIPCLYLYMDVKPGNTSVTNVHITGNTSDSRGGGIGSNGTVIIGGEYTPPETFSVTKEWTNGCPTNLKQLNIWLLGMDKKDPSKVVYVAYNQLYGTFESNTTSAWRDEMVAITDDDNPRTFMTPMTGDNRPVGVAVLLGLLALCMMGVFGILAFRKNDENR